MALRSLITLTVPVAGALVLGGCGPGFWLGVGAKAGVAVAEERSLGDQAVDATLKVEISERLFRYDEALFQDVSIDVTEGRVLLAGVVETPEDRIDAVRLTWQVDGIKEVANEIQVTDGSFEYFVNDVWISTQLRNDLLWDKDVASINYNVETVHGVVYLTGIAKNQAELNRVVAHARTIPKVREIVNYVRVLSPAQST